jgi:hypothetical protein
MQAFHLQPATPLVLQLLLCLGSGNNRFNGQAHSHIQGMYLCFFQAIPDNKKVCVLKLQ